MEQGTAPGKDCFVCVREIEAQRPPAGASRPGRKRSVEDRRGGRAPVIALALGFVILPGTAHANHVPGHRPKLAIYATGTGNLYNGQRDTLASYDLAVVAAPPIEVADFRKRNPNIELLFQWLPQTIANWAEDDSTWYPDTTWSLIRLSEFYAQKNNWYMRDIWGQRIPEWIGWEANWTKYCPLGVYGTSRGLTYAQWLMQVAMPYVIESGQVWEPWGLGSSAYEGLHIEVFVDCVGSYGWQNYQYADPDQDGIAEGVYSTCSMGGDQDSLSILYRQINDTFHPALSKLQDEGVLVVFNAGNPHMGPAWNTDVTSTKLEGWMTQDSRYWMTWRDWFYGLTDPTHQHVWGPGYSWAETFVHHTGVDSIEGWNHSILEVEPYPGTSDTACARVRRWGLATSLLGDGYMTYTLDQASVHWYPDFDLDMGLPNGGYYRRLIRKSLGADTLYCRAFTQGLVEVNPNNYCVDGIPSQDARFNFWPGPAAAPSPPPRLPNKPELRVPNPYRANAMISVLGFGAGSDLAVYDLLGRRIRDLGAGSGADSRVVRWDGRTGSGARAPAGLYWIEARSGRTDLRRRLLLIQG